MNINRRQAIRGILTSLIAPMVFIPILKDRHIWMPNGLTFKQLNQLATDLSKFERLPFYLVKNEMIHYPAWDKAFAEFYERSFGYFVSPEFERAQLDNILLK